MVKSKFKKIKFANIYYYSGLNLNLISLNQLNYIEVNFKIKQNIISASKNKIIYFKTY